MLLPEYNDKWIDHMEDYQNGINEDLQRSIEKGPYRASTAESVGSTTQNESVIMDRKKRQSNDRRCVRELRGALTPIVYNYIRGCNSAQENLEQVEREISRNLKN